jgi:hypothetical protein
MAFKSIDVKVHSRQARNFLKRRLATEWREGKKETHFMRQKLWLERAGALIQALHMKGKMPSIDDPIDFDFSRKQRNKLTF